MGDKGYGAVWTLAGERGRRLCARWGPGVEAAGFVAGLGFGRDLVVLVGDAKIKKHDMEGPPNLDLGKPHRSCIGPKQTIDFRVSMGPMADCSWSVAEG